MAKLLKLRRGTTSQHSSFTGAEGEVTVDTDKETLVVHDGSTAGGHPVAAEDLANVSSSTIAGRLSNDSLATSKLAAGALPSDVTVATANLGTTGVTAGQYGSSSAIPIVTVNNKGQVTAASTTAIDSTTIANGTSNVAVANNGDITATRSGTARLVVDNDGADVTGNLNATGNIRATGNGSTISVGDNNDLYISHTNNGLIDCNTGDLTITTQNAMNLKTADAEFGIQLVKHGGVTLYHDNNGPKAQTTSTGFDVTGNVTATGEGTFSGNKVTIEGTQPSLYLKDTDNNDDFSIFNNHGQFLIYDQTDGVSRFTIASDGATGIAGSLNVGGNITVPNGTVDGVDIATRDTLFGGLTSSSGVLSNGVTATTQAQSDNTTKVSTTAYVRTAIANAQAFPSGTKMLFQQTSAPTGWTKVTSSVDNKALRIVSGSVSSGGNQAFTSAFASRTPAGSVGTTGNSSASFSANATTGNSSASFSANATTGNSGASTSNVSTSGNVNNHTLSTNQMPSHSHSFQIRYHDYYENNHAPQRTSGGSNSYGNQNTNNTGGSGAHSHGFSGSSHSHNVNNHTHSVSVSGNTGNHTHSVAVSGNTGNHTHNAGAFSGTAMDFAVQYIDVIIATKD